MWCLATHAAGRSAAWASGVLLACGPEMPFTPPSPHQRLEAIGSTRDLPPLLQRAMDPGEDFQPIPSPRPGDWLAVHREPGQSYEQFVRSNPNAPDQRRSKLYLLPLGKFVAGRSPPLDRLETFATAFFAMEVRVLPPLDLAAARITNRTNPHTGRRQLLTGDVLVVLERRLPDDAFCLLGITTEDLYPDPAWNFVFGQASPRQRVGVYSFARYDPRFFGETPPENVDDIVLRRSCKVLAHEAAHMFGIDHCVFFHCLMNGSNHLGESDARPLHLCPVDLRKLHRSVGFDVVQRYRRLRDLYREVGFDDEERWLTDRLRRLEPDS